jgi:outer membrane receptor protein involved in Fe transport
VGFYKQRARQQARQRIIPPPRVEQGRFSGFRNLQLTLGVKNFTDRDPPYTNGGGQFAAGYDIAYADVRGRFVYGSLKVQFK